MSSEPNLTAPAFLRRVEDWFYRRETPYALAWVRILFPLAMLVAVLPRIFYVRELYSNDGAPTPFWLLYDMKPMYAIPSANLATALYAAMIFFLITTCIGWKTRVSLTALTLLIPYFGLLDTLGTLTKYTIIATHLSLLLALSQCGSVWSIDSWLERRANPNWTLPKHEVWPQRLLQLLVGCIYLGAAVTKIQSSSFFGGEQTYYWMLTNVNFPNPMGEWLSQYPWTLVFTGYTVALWEVLFIFFVWKGPTRWAVLSVGVLFHLMTYLLLGLVVFPLLYLAIYFCFLTESEARCAGEFVARRVALRLWLQRIEHLPARLATWPTFAAALICFGALGVAAERQMDVYQANSTPLTLEPLSTDLVNELLRNDQKIDVVDLVDRFDVGTETLGGYIVNARTEFVAGQKIIAQARLISTRSDLWIDFELRDSMGRLVAGDSMLVPREDNAANFSALLAPQLETGEFELRILLNGEPASRRRLMIRSAGN